jgi:tetratricopeptide (TPR) repeat protein
VPALAVASFVPVALVIHLTSSRGALLAAVAGAAASIFFAADRRRALLAAAVGGAGALVAVVAAASRDDVLDATAGDLTVSGVAVAAVALVAAAAAAVVFARLRARTTPAPERLRRLARPAIVLAAVALAAVAVAVGPSALIGDFKPAAGEATSDAGGALASGSGRSEFWETALDAFGEDPLRGVGAGGYAAYWTREGDLDVPVANAHSAPLESLAELGVPGGLALLALAVAVGIGARRLVADPLARPAAGAAAGVAVVGLIAFTLDWTWEMPAAGVPAILAAGLLTGRGLRPRSAAGPAVDPLRAGGLGIAVPAALVAVVSVWAGAVIALAAVQLERGESALADGDLPEAAAAARAAEEIEPWSADPSLLLAEIEQVGGNFDAARRRAERAIRLSPDDFRAWLLLADISASLGEPEVSGNYALHAVSLAPGALSRRGATLQTGP